MMTMDRFQALLDAYGADPDRWPDAERDAARAFLAGNDAATTALNSAAELDALIAPAAINAVPSDMLTARLLRALPQAEFFGDWKHVAAAAALALAVGLGGGYATGAFVPAGPDDASYYEIAFDGLDSDFQVDWEGGA